MQVLRKKRKKINVVVLIFIGVLFFSCNSNNQEAHVLVFSKTAGYRHTEAIQVGKNVFLDLGEKYNFLVDTTEDASVFNEENLKKYRAIIFLNVSGEVLNTEQRNSLKRYIEAGGGFMGIHGSTDAERDWPWYGKLIGAYFESHPSDPNVREGTYVIQDKNHPATKFLPDTWERRDEFYDFKKVNPDINVLIEIDESTYQTGSTGIHPAVWYHEFDGGRSFYTAMGHTRETYEEPLFVQTLWGGLKYVMEWEKAKDLDYSRVKTKKIPDSNRFTRIDLLGNLNEPMAFDFSADGKIFFIERPGNVHVYDLEKKKDKVIGTIPVFDNFEDGLLGIVLDPNYEENNWLYLFYTRLDGRGFCISRFQLDQEGLLKLSSEKVLLNIPKEILDGSHTGGDMVFDPRGTGNLFIAVGDNTSPRSTGYAPIDERPGRIEFDAQRSAANTNDLRGKILRIHPELDGTYTIPEGNLFEPGTAKTHPEIYSMGHRQPWRLSMDSQNGWLYVGEVGPDARKDSIGFGPAGYDEFNIVKKPGNFGWPYFVANNKAYWNVDFMNNKPGDYKFKADEPSNNSPNNNGRIELPPAQDAFLWYTYAKSNELSLLGSGGRSATGGPIFHVEDFEDADNAFPDYYDNKWFITDWMRGWIMVVTMDAYGNYEGMEPFLPDQKFSSPIDMGFGPDGNLYILDYGNGWFKGNPDARLVKISYNAGNRKPVVKLSANRRGGSLPLTVILKSEGSHDPDGDILSYDWKIISESGGIIHKSSEKNTITKINDPGIYDAVLLVKDSHGAKSRSKIQIIAGNAAPQLSINIEGSHKFYSVGKTIKYEVKLSDKEDGSLRNGSIKPSEIKFNILYLPEGINVPEEVKNESMQPRSKFARAEVMINEGDCRSCHSMNRESIGPTYREIAERYKNDKETINYLSNKIINGGKGAWGEVTMSAHPDMNPTDAKKIAKYILSLADADKIADSLPLKGQYTFEIPEGDNGKGIFLFKAAYTDKGAGELPGLTSQKLMKLYNEDIPGPKKGY